MADTIERLYKLTVDGSQAARQLGDIARSADNLDKSFSNSINGITRFAKVLTAGLTAGAIVAGIKNIIDGFDQLSKDAQKIGIAAEELQKLRYAADMSGVSSETLDKALKKLSVGMADLKDGSTDAAKALRAIGAKEGEDTITTLKRVADQFAKLPSTVDRVALSVKIFGEKVGPELVPFLIEGAEGVQKLADEAERFGGIISGDVLNAAADFNDNLDRLKRTAAGIGAQLTAGMLPGLQAITQMLTDSVTAGEGFVSTGAEIGEMLATLSGWALKATTTLRAFWLLNIQLDRALKDPLNAKTIISQAIDDVNELERVTNAKLEKMRSDLERFKAEAAGGGAAPADTRAAERLRVAEELRKRLQAEEEAKERARKSAKAAADAAKRDAEQVAASERTRMLVAAEMIRIEKEESEANAKFWEEEKRREKDRADAQRSLIRSLDTVGAATEDFEANQKAINDLFNEGAINVEQYNRMLAQLAGTTIETIEKQRSELDVLNEGFEGFFDNLANSAGDAEQVFKRTIQSIIAELLKLWAKKYIIDMLFGAAGGSMSSGSAPAGAGGVAIGGAFDAGRILPFARGGVISAPLTYPMALMGEAGPEAILPLKRARDGNLGVQAGASSLNLTVNNYSDSRVRARQTGPSDFEIIVEQARKAVAADLRKGGNDVARSLEQAYGIGRGAAAAY